MANRYWVGGTGNWDATTTNWSASSGGAGGASVPTASDDVFFDTLSNATAYVVTLTTSPICNSVSVAGPATGNVTIAGSATWGVLGSFTLAATGITWTYSGTITFNSASAGNIITTNGNVLTCGININTTGGTWTLGSALTANNGITLNGTFSTANFNLTVNSVSNITTNSTNTRTITLGSSTITCGGWSVSNATGLTLNANTSTITLLGTGFTGGGKTYYNVTKASNGFAIADSGNTFNALTNTTIASAGTFVCSFAGNQTIGTLTINGGIDATRRASIQTTSGLTGTQVTLTVASFVTNGFIDFRDINLAGAASPLTVSTGGDCGNNTNITLATPKTVYWSLVAGGSWNQATAWATSSGGAPAIANFPLPQDTAIIDDAGLTSGNTITMGANNPSFGNINISGRTLPMTLGFGTIASVIYGNLTLSSAVTTTFSSNGLTFSGFNKTQTITSAGTSIAVAITVLGRLTTVLLADAFALSGTVTLTLTAGTLDLNAQTASMRFFASTGSSVRSIAFNGGTMTVLGSNFTASGSNFTTTGLGIISMNLATSKTFAGGGFSYPTLNQGGAGTLVITGANTFGNMTNTVQPCTITFPASTTTTVSNFNVNGTAGNLVTLNSSTPGTRFTLAKI